MAVTQLSEALIDEAHRHLEDMADRLMPTRKGRSWDLWIEDRPISVQVDEESNSLGLAAGCNQPEDWQVLEQLASSLAVTLGGQASKLEK